MTNQAEGRREHLEGGLFAIGNMRLSFSVLEQLIKSELKRSGRQESLSEALRIVRENKRRLAAAQKELSEISLEGLWQ